MNNAEPSRFWWLRRAKYIAVFLRELSSVFILAYVLLYLQILSQLRGGSTDLLSQLGTTPFLFLSLVMLAFSLYHSVTWFMLLPKVQPIKLGNLMLRGGRALLINLVILFFASWLIAFLVFGVHFPFGSR